MVPAGARTACKHLPAAPSLMASRPRLALAGHGVMPPRRPLAAPRRCTALCGGQASCSRGCRKCAAYVASDRRGAAGDRRVVSVVISVV